MVLQSFSYSASPPPELKLIFFPEGEIQAFENSHDFANPLYFCLEYRKVKTGWCDAMFWIQF